MAKSDNVLSIKSLKTTGYGAASSNPLVCNFAPGIIPNPRLAFYWDDPPRALALHNDLKAREMVTGGSRLEAHLITQPVTFFKPVTNSQLLPADPEDNSASTRVSSSEALISHAPPSMSGGLGTNVGCRRKAKEY
ncbi:hypothetical protein Pyn_32640 [Prunus yedoensis var. nudiflora]|uniref:Uncharacterized protein n=1 Tax=Prunus yedoensis var. nudiflora TaxID=2094558 RepID=A0A314ZM16_PRUYE|nr:hypothetical protein Pyn_32640 [Prunus yedoensis var. nudiflora]